MIVCLLVSLFVFLMYFDDVGTHIGPEAFVWKGKTDVYVEPKAMVQNRTYGWVYAAFSYPSVCCAAGEGEQDGVSVELAGAQGEMLS